MNAFNILINNIMENPLEWKQDSYMLTNRNKGVGVWTANGFFFYELQRAERGGGTIMRFNFFQKLRFTYIRRKHEKISAGLILEETTV